MSEIIKDFVQPESYDDFELVIDYLNKHLDPEKVALVEQRLAEDPAFRELAAPMMLVWTVPTRLQRHPRPPGELERHWDEFTKRAGFVHQRKKARWRWATLALLTTFLAAVLWFQFGFGPHRKPLGAFHYQPLSTVGDSVVLSPRVTAHLAPGASVNVRRPEREPDYQGVLLKGSATFRVQRKTAFWFIPSITGIVVRAGAGEVGIAMGEVHVSRRGDTTDVYVRPRKHSENGAIADKILDVAVLWSTAYPSRSISVQEGQRGRAIADGTVMNLTTGEKQP